MDKVKLLRIVLIFFIIGDFLMLLIWLPTLFLVVGIPACAIILWLIILHIMSFKSLGRKYYVSKHLLVQQIIAGVLITLLNAMAVFFVSAFSFDSTKDYTSQAIFSTSILLIFCFSAMFAYVYVAFGLLKKATSQFLLSNNNINNTADQPFNPAAPVPEVFRTDALTLGPNINVREDNKK